ncbi:MAG TPA: PEP-CTERM sorting domain-containing protein [Rhodocyclaceae bacterium]
MNPVNVFLKGAVACGCAAVVSLAQASSVTLTPTTTWSGNTAWQNIRQVSYSLIDNNHDGLLDVGDTVNFTMTMQKQYWGTHRFDAMKVWLSGPTVDPATGQAVTKNLATNTYVWDYAAQIHHQNMQYYNRPYDPYSDMPWEGGDKNFTLSYTFLAAGNVDLAVAVMCSRDLSRLNQLGNDDDPVTADWNSWTKNIGRYQGEDKRYTLTILPTPPAPPVPEPETYSMMIAGLAVLGAVARRRKQG